MKTDTGNCWRILSAYRIAVCWRSCKSSSRSSGPFGRAAGLYSGGNAEFAERYNSFAGADTDAKHLKQLMQQHADDLEQQGVKYLNWRSNGQRLMKIWYEPPLSDDGDGQNGVCESVVPVGTDPSETVTPDVSETVDTIEVETYRDGAADQYENSDDRTRDIVSVVTVSDEKECAQ